MYNLTDSQKDLLKQLVQKIRDGHIPEEFKISSLTGKTDLVIFGNKRVENCSQIFHILEISRLVKKALENNNLIQCVGINCSLTGKAYEAVDNNFSQLDTSFVKHLTPLADITNLDEELKKRCLPILGAGSADEKMWDSAVRVAGVILEERLRDVGRIPISDDGSFGQPLVNNIFGKGGTLASRFLVDSERQGYRDLYAGVFATFRNPSAHRLVDPTPEEGGAFIVFVNFLLKKLEDLR
jgi:hypothetical protein